MATKTAKDELSIVRTEHINATHLREGFAAFSRGDLDTVRALLADNCSWTVAGTGPLAGTVTGWTQIEKLFGRIIDITNGTVSLSVISCLADDTHAVAVYDVTSTIKGATETHRNVMVQEIGADGRATVVHDMALDQAAADAFISR